MKPKHTPAPWEASTQSGTIFTNRAIITTVNDFSFTREEVEANSKLIAAAPELLEDLQNLNSIIETIESYGLTKALPIEYRDLLSTYKLQSKKTIKKATE